MNTTCRLAAAVVSLVAAACTGYADPQQTEVGATHEALTGVTGPAFYVDGVLYRTVGTPTDLPRSAPADSFETIYSFRGAQAHNVATAAPGDPGFKGGRWMVHGLSFADYAAALGKYDSNGSGDFDSDEEVLAALDAGAATDIGVLKVFECPVIPVPPSA
jgi:hypothetical protein